MTAPETLTDSAVYRLARQAAIFGGLLLMVAMLTTVASVLTNGLFGKPILGDTEIVESLVGVAVAAFLPWCQVRGANHPGPPARSMRWPIWYSPSSRLC